MHENKMKNGTSRPATSSTTRLLAILLIGVGVIWILCSVCSFPFRAQGFNDFGRAMGEWGADFGRQMGEWGSDFGRQMGEMGREIGQWGSDFGQSVGRMGSDFGGSIGDMVRTLARVGSSFCATGCALALIVIGLALIVTRRPRRRDDDLSVSKRSEL